MSRNTASPRIEPYLATFRSFTSCASPEETIEVYAASEEEALARAKTFSLHTLHKREVLISAPAGYAR